MKIPNWDSGKILKEFGVEVPNKEKSTIPGPLFGDF
jgi:hypothetical protein